MVHSHTGEKMKIINNSIRHEINDLVLYKNKVYQIKNIYEDLVTIKLVNVHKYIRTNIFNIYPLERIK